MCLNCGCGDPEDDRGRAENLTIDDLRRAAEVNHQSLEASARHILETIVLTEERSAAAPARSGPTPRAGGVGRDAGADDGGRAADAGLAAPAGREPPPPVPRGTPGTES